MRCGLGIQRPKSEAIGTTDIASSSSPPLERRREMGAEGMHDRRDTPLRVAMEGLLAGVVGALGVTVMVAIARRLTSAQTEPLDLRAADGISAGQALSEGPNMPPNMNRVTATFVQKIATGLFGTSLSARQQDFAGTAWHLAYGGFWGIVYGLVQSSLTLPSVLLGSVHGLVVWAISFAWLVPKMKLVLPPNRQHPRTTAMVVGVHAAYGLIVASVVHWLRGRD